MPTNDYISYMKEDLFKNLEKEIELPLKNIIKPQTVTTFKQCQDQALDPISIVNKSKSIGVNTHDVTSYNTTQSLNFDS